MFCVKLNGATEAKRIDINDLLGLEEPDEPLGEMKKKSDKASQLICNIVSCLLHLITQSKCPLYMHSMCEHLLHLT